MVQVCPISFNRVDSNIVRGIAFVVVLVTLLLLMTKESVFAFILLFDFMVRSMRLSHLSLFYMISKFVLKCWGVAPKLSDEAPKRFALYLGLVASFLLFISSIFGFGLLTLWVAIILLTCALLETAFDYCIGCKIYYYMQVLRGIFNNGRNIK